METIVVTLSLARAHKLADHVRARLSREQLQFQQHTRVVQLTGRAGAQQVNDFKAHREKADSALQAFGAWNAALTAIRTAIGRGNVSIVSDLLAQREAIARELDVLHYLLDERPESIQPEEVIDFRVLSEGTMYPMIGVSLVTPAALEVARAKGEALKVQLLKLGNELADANTQRITVPLPRTVAEQLGLKA